MIRRAVIWAFFLSAWGGVQGQGCTLEERAGISGVLPAPNLFDLFTGGYKAPGKSYYQTLAAQLRLVGKVAEAEEAEVRAGMIPSGVALSSRVQTLCGFVKDSMALPKADSGDLCGNRVVELAVKYVRKFAKGKSGVPLFAGFNGGFANFLEDSLGEGQKGLDWAKVIGVMVQVQLAGILPAEQSAELLGDVILRHDSRFDRRWLASMAYLRAGMSAKDSVSREAYDIKAIYALEADQPNYRFFNRSRFRRFSAAFRKEARYQDSISHSRKEICDGWAKGGKDPVGEWAKTYPVQDTSSKDFEYYPMSPAGPVWEFVKKDLEHEERLHEGLDPNADPMNRELDMKKIKTNIRTNAYAIFLILTIVGAVVFFWLKIRAAVRKSQKEGGAE